MVTIRAKLDHLAIISWAVEATRVAAMLPAPLVPRTIDRKGHWGLVSMTMIQDTTLGTTYAQLNERTYVMRADGTGKGAFFWRSHAATRQALLVRSLLGAPEFVADVEVRVRGTSYAFKRNGRLVAKLDLSRAGTTPRRYRELDVGRAGRLSANPMIGYTMNRGRLYATVVRHNRIRPRRAKVLSVDPSFMLPAPVIDAADKRTPLIALYQRETPFWIDVPPRPVSHRMSRVRVRP